MTVLSREDFVARLRATDEVGAIVYRLDSSPESYRVRNYTNRARSSVTSTIQRVPVVAVRSARRVADHHSQQFGQQTEAALGVAVPTLDTGLDQRIQHFIHENVSLMQKLGEKTMGDVESIVARAFTTGESADDVAAELMRRFDIAERHARFIARDQMQRLYAQVARMRNKETGVRVFQWMTMEDADVRSWHAVKDGKFFPYEGSRAPSFFPGDEPNCRCWEEAVFEEIKARVAELLGKGRQRVA
jgi:SPP1 gp7 family putative phage head morphogenesis protein